MQQAGPTAAITYRGPKELSAGEEIVVVYNPPQAPEGGRARLAGEEAGADREGEREEPLFFMGGFNGWDGETSPLILPAMPQADGSYEVTLAIPVFAKTVDFIFSDGIRFDTNDGDYYHLRIRHVQERDAKGNVKYFVQDEEGQLTPTGEVDERVDPQELERMIEEEMQRRKQQEQADVAAQEAAAAGADDGGVAPEPLRVRDDMRVKVSKEEQRQAQRLRAEASAAGELLGLLKIQCNEVRDAFDRFDDDRTALLARRDVRPALELLGFDLSDEELQELVSSHAGEDEYVDMLAFMHMFAELDSNGVGIKIL